MFLRAPKLSSIRKAPRTARLGFFSAVTALLLLTTALYLLPSSSAVTNGGSITTLGSPLTENFDTLPASGSVT